MVSISRQSTVLAQTIGTSSSTMDILGETTREISAMVEVIRDIANQTNLLALNAAIEAARAGDSGRGFSVVADEVRKLSERTAQSTARITAAIEAVQAKTLEAIDSMRAGMEQAHSSALAIEDASGRIRDIRERTEILVCEIAEISRQLGAQSASGTSVSHGVGKIAEANEQNSAVMRDTKSSSKTVREVALRLQAAVHHFSV
jgi:methyl-accepting chemotaxis protein